MRRRALIATGVGLGLTGLAGAGALLRRPPEDTPADRPIATAKVLRETLVLTKTVPGKLAYGPERPLVSRLSGTVTAMAAIGATVERGKTLFRIDDTPVVLMFGGIPAYRELTEATVGNDVSQFAANLKALGYGRLSGAAIRRWQKDLGLQQSGVVELGRVVYADEAIRVAGHSVNPGEVASDPVLTVTGTRQMVMASLKPENLQIASPGTKVAVELASGKETGGTVESVRTPPGEQTGIGQEPGLEAVVSLDDPFAVGGAESGPARVRFTVQQRANVLTVPIGALVALAEGGFGLQVFDGTSHYIGVTTGLFANGKVEVSGDGVGEGMTVGMAR